MIKNIYKRNNKALTEKSVRLFLIGIIEKNNFPPIF